MKTRVYAFTKLKTLLKIPNKTAHLNSNYYYYTFFNFYRFITTISPCLENQTLEDNIYKNHFIQNPFSKTLEQKNLCKNYFIQNTKNFEKNDFIENPKIVEKNDFLLNLFSKTLEEKKLCKNNNFLEKIKISKNVIKNEPNNLENIKNNDFQKNPLCKTLEENVNFLENSKNLQNVNKNNFMENPKNSKNDPLENLFLKTLEETVKRNDFIGNAKNSWDVLQNWGCNDTDIEKIYSRRPSLRKDVDLVNLQSKLNLLKKLGINASDLVKIINCRPRFLSGKINCGLDEKLVFLEEFFGSREVLLKAIVRNPSLLTYDFHDTIRPVIDTYYSMGLSRQDLIHMLLSRPTLIPRTSFSDEKLEFIRKTCVLKESKMYKYVVGLFAISRIETIRAKIANFEKYGVSEDEVLRLFGRSPVVLTLSTDKVQRNMTYCVSMMKLPANVIVEHPFLLLVNLEVVLKPRIILAGKIQDMGVYPQIKGDHMLRALRMKEKRFIKAFIKCHPQDISDELMAFYVSAKQVKRLAESSKKNVHKGFPF